MLKHEDNNMPTPEETVASFLAQCGKGRSAMMDAFRTYFTPQTIWEMVGSATTTGIEEALALVEATQASLGMDCLFVETLSIATTGCCVLTERIDNIRAADGRNLHSVRTMGIFEVQGGKLI